jgi:hypothetical protein
MTTAKEVRSSLNGLVFALLFLGFAFGLTVMLFLIGLGGSSGKVMMVSGIPFLVTIVQLLKQVVPKHKDFKKLTMINKEE